MSLKIAITVIAVIANVYLTSAQSECVVYDFEDGELGTSETCTVGGEWEIGSYEAIDIAPPSSWSSNYISTGSAMFSCIASGTINMVENGILQIQYYAEGSIYLGVMGMEGSDSFINEALNVNIGVWTTVSFTIPRDVIGQFQITGSPTADNSRLLIDSFGYADSEEGAEYCFSGNVTLNTPSTTGFPEDLTSTTTEQPTTLTTTPTSEEFTTPTTTSSPEEVTVTSTISTVEELTTTTTTPISEIVTSTTTEQPTTLTTTPTPEEFTTPTTTSSPEEVTVTSTISTVEELTTTTTTPISEIVTTISTTANPGEVSTISTTSIIQEVTTPPTTDSDEDTTSSTSATLDETNTTQEESGTEPPEGDNLTSTTETPSQNIAASGESFWNAITISGSVVAIGITMFAFSICAYEIGQRRAMNKFKELQNSEYGASVASIPNNIPRVKIQSQTLNNSVPRSQSFYNEYY